MLAGPYGHPLHPALAAVPIGAWIASFVFDVASRVVGQPGFLTSASRWLIAIGVLGALAAATVGFLDLIAIPPRTPAFRTALVHMSVNLAVTARVRDQFSDPRRPACRGAGGAGSPWQSPRSAWPALSVSGYLGGKLAYRYGVRVADESTQAEGYRVTKENL